MNYSADAFTGLGIMFSILIGMELFWLVSNYNDLLKERTRLVKIQADNYEYADDTLQRKAKEAAIAAMRKKG